MASLKTLSDATFEILGQFFRRVVSILAPNGVKKIAELGNSLRRLHYDGLIVQTDLGSQFISAEFERQLT